MLTSTLLLSVLLTTATSIDPSNQQQHRQPPSHEQGLPNSNKKPNIIFIFTDDQDRRLGSTDYQSVLHREIIDKGVEITNHFGTVAQCCPARASILRGQQAHNTNITNVHAPGGNYDKWVLAGEDKDYLPHWLKQAGYRTEYIGKFFNQYNTRNYATTPKGWDHIDALVDPYTYAFNQVVMSANGQTPLTYPGFHQTDVLRAKALDRIDKAFASHDHEPLYLTIAPAACHVSQERNPDFNSFPPVPLARHANELANINAPRFPNYNPSQEFTDQKPSWLKTLRLMNETEIEYTDFHFRQRARSLLGVDEIIEDVVEKLKAIGELDNTYIIYSSDNGYHLGAHRAPAGKELPYGEDTNLPFAVRGPNIPAGVKSHQPQTNIDLAPTFLDIAGLPAHQYPLYLDGQSLLGQWIKPNETEDENEGEGTGKEIINIEYWGYSHFEAPPNTFFQNTTYKTVRIAANEEAWLYAKWCNGDAELYNTKDDPYELSNLAWNNTDPRVARIIDRLNALLLVSKSCTGGTCRNPWTVLQPVTNATYPKDSSIQSLRRAMNPQFDAYFASFPKVQFSECLDYQLVSNERPFYPEEAEAQLGQLYREPTLAEYNLDTSPDDANYKLPTDAESVHAGGWEQRHVALEKITEAARELTRYELSQEGIEQKRGLEGIVPA